MIIFDEKIVAIWYLYIPAMGGDYMAAIREIKERAIMHDFKSVSSDEKLYEFINDDDFKDFIKRFQEAPFTYIRLSSKEETEEEK